MFVAKNIGIKICGLNSESAVRAVIESGVNYAGFVYYPKSPRHVSITQMVQLKNMLPETIKSVIVLVEPDDDLLAEIINKVQPDFLQLHGDETPQRLTEIHQKFPQIKLIKAIPVRDYEDIKQSEIFYDVADFILFDAKPTNSNMMHGGNGISFDWSLLAENAPLRNWFLSGGLNMQNITEAIKKTGAKFIDVSSGVESSAGVKDAELIKQFVNIVRRY